MDEPMNFHPAAPKIPPRILCIGMPVRDLTFRIQELPERGFKVNASHFDEICGGNALNGALLFKLNCSHGVLLFAIIAASTHACTIAKLQIHGTFVRG